MLKERITELLDRYEYGEEDGGWLTADEVCEELEEILDDEPWDEALSRPLDEAVHAFVMASYECARYHGHVSDGSDKFIEAVERIIGYE